MRIISGIHRGRRIQAPPGRATRPMLDRVREALFSTLAPWIQEAFVVDLFAGSGSLGIEALSRGAERAKFVEEDARTIGVLTQNAVDLGLMERVEIVRGDALAPWAVAAEGDSRGADIVFFDPPYPLVEGVDTRRGVLDAVRHIVEFGLAPEGVVAFHARRGRITKADFGDGIEAAERIYGTNSIWYLQREGEA